MIYLTKPTNEEEAVKYRDHQIQQILTNDQPTLLYKIEDGSWYAMPVSLEHLQQVHLLLSDTLILDWYNRWPNEPDMLPVSKALTPEAAEEELKTLLLNFYSRW